MLLAHEQELLAHREEPHQWLFLTLLNPIASVLWSEIFSWCNLFLPLMPGPWTHWLQEQLQVRREPFLTHRTHKLPSSLSSRTSWALLLCCTFLLPAMLLTLLAKVPLRSCTSSLMPQSLLTSSWSCWLFRSGRWSCCEHSSEWGWSG